MKYTVAASLLATSASAYSFGASKATAASGVPQTFDEMPGQFGFAATNAPLVARAFPGMQTYFREAELKHARISMLAAVGFPLAEKFHPLWGGVVDEPSYVAFQSTPLETFWPIVVGTIGIIEAASAIPTFEAADGGQWFRIKSDHVAGDLGFDPLGFSESADLAESELAVGRIAMLGIFGMVVQELNTHAALF